MQMKDAGSLNYNDEELWRKIKLNDYKAFEIIYHKYSTLMFNSGYAILKDKEACEDVLQEVFVNIWVARQRLNIYSLKSYLLKSLRNQVLMYLKKHKAHISLEAIENNIASFSQIENSIAYRKELNDLYRKLETLPERCKEVFLLSRKYQLSNKEISEKLNISVKTVENQITIAIKKLKPVAEKTYSYSIILLSLRIAMYIYERF